MFSTNNRPWSPWLSAYCCLSLSSNIVCLCLSTRPAASHPASRNPPPCLHLLLLPAPGSRMGPSSPRGKHRDMAFSCQSSPQVWHWHPSPARSSLEDISLGWGRTSATHRHEKITFCLGDMLCKPTTTHIIISVAFAYVLHFNVACIQWVAWGEPFHMYQIICSGASQQGCWLSQHCLWNICVLSCWLHSWKDYRCPSLPPWPLPM